MLMYILQAPEWVSEGVGDSFLECFTGNCVKLTQDASEAMLFYSEDDATQYEDANRQFRQYEIVSQ
jgi:hypothetical protein